MLLGGENIEPVPIEDTILESEYIDQVMVVGQDQKFLGALVVPNQEALEKYAAPQEIAWLNKEDLLDNPQTMELISDEIQSRVCAKRGFPRVRAGFPLQAPLEALRDGRGAEREAVGEAPRRHGDLPQGGRRAVREIGRFGPISLSRAFRVRFPHDPFHSPARAVTERQPRARLLGGERNFLFLVPRHFRNEQSFVEQRDALLARRYERATLRSVLEAQNGRFSALPAAMANIARLSDPRCLVVIGGQQAGLFGGPLSLPRRR